MTKRAAEGYALMRLIVDDPRLTKTAAALLRDLIAASEHEHRADLSHAQAIERQHEADWLRALPTPSQAKH